MIGIFGRLTCCYAFLLLFGIIWYYFMSEAELILELIIFLGEINSFKRLYIRNHMLWYLVRAVICKNHPDCCEKVITNRRLQRRWKYL